MKMRITEQSKVQPKQAKKMNLLLNLMKNDAVRIAMTWERLTAKPLMYILKWKLLSMSEGA
jgi:hypothetical protein